MPFLLDTSALSEPLKRSPKAAFMRRLGEVPAREIFTSSVCLMELRYGCSLRGNDGLWERIQQVILAHVRVLPFSGAEATRCGDLLALLSRSGTQIGTEDTQIGATALVHHCHVVTFNKKHFEKIPGLRIENWLD